MTFSIVARTGDAYGVAVASKFIAVGSVVPAARLGIGAIATQAMAKVSYLADGLALLAAGSGAEDTVDRLISLDEGRDDRQVGVADLRVDDHREATGELARLLDLHDLYLGSPGTVLPLEGPLADEVRQHLMVLGRTQPDLHEALEDWAGEANFEMRMTPDGIDSRVLRALREADA